MDENVLISVYPKVGSTWVRLVLANIMKNKGVSPALWRPVTLQEVDAFIPPTLSPPDTGIVMTHRHHNATQGFNKLIGIVRDPVDVMVSLYFHLFSDRKHYILPKRITFSRMIRNTSPWHQYIEVGVDGYVNHVNSYDTFAGDTLVRRYEDLRNDPSGFEEIAGFCGFQPGTDLLEWSVAVASFGRIQLEEIRRKFQTGEDPNYLFARSGCIGCNRDYLFPEDRGYIEERIGYSDLLKDFYG